MHEYRRFVQSELDARGWRQADLVRRSGLSRQLVSNILNDPRSAIGQMPDSSTMDGLARGFGIPVETVRTAASRALVGYSDDGEPLSADLASVSTDALLHEVRRRIEATGVTDATQEQESRPEASSEEHGSAGEAQGERPMSEVRRLPRKDQAPDVDDEPPTLEEAEAARSYVSQDELRRQYGAEPEDVADPEGPEGGA